MPGLFNNSLHVNFKMFNILTTILNFNSSKISNQKKLLRAAVFRNGYKEINFQKLFFVL